jgi:hypothetical protein
MIKHPKMTPEEISDAEALASSFRAATSQPLVVPTALYEALHANGVSMKDIALLPNIMERIHMPVRLTEADAERLGLDLPK